MKVERVKVAILLRSCCLLKGAYDVAKPDDEGDDGDDDEASEEAAGSGKRL